MLYFILIILLLGLCAYVMHLRMRIKILKTDNESLHKWKHHPSMHTPPRNVCNICSFPYSGSFCSNCGGIPVTTDHHQPKKGSKYRSIDDE